MADVLQDVGLRSVSMGLRVLRRCWGNSSLANHCALAAAALPKRPVGTPGNCQLLAGVREVVWDRDVLSGKFLGAHTREQEVGGR